MRVRCDEPHRALWISNHPGILVSLTSPVATCSETDDAVEQIVGSVRKYRPDADVAPIRAAYTFACEKHAGQMRLSGEPYITHLVAVAEILAGLEMDIPTIVAGFLHDVVEDT